jgi:predicted exporter
MVLLEDIREPGAVREACVSVPGAEYIDRVGELSALLGRYRAQASALVGGAYAVILLLLVVRYGGRGGVLVMMPPVLSAALTVGGLALSGVSLTLMHVLALLLVLGIGIDYTIFFAESGGRSKATMLAVALSACTTFLSFGLLFVSRTPAVRSIGLVVAPTSILCMVLAPVAARVKGPCRR